MAGTRKGTAVGKKPARLTRTASSPLATASILPGLATQTVAENVATLLLVERAMRRSGFDLGDLTSAVSVPGAVVVLRAEVLGFASAAHRLLEDGAILPGRAQTLDVSYIRAEGHVRFSDDSDIGWRVVTMVEDADPDEADGVLETSVGSRIARTARTGYPLLALMEHQAVPSLLALAANPVLEAGALDLDLLAETMERVAGHDVEAARAALAPSVFDPATLSVADLSVAIRPRIPLERSVATLTHIARLRQGEREEKSSTTPRGLSPSRDDGDWDRSARSLSGSSKGGGREKGKDKNKDNAKGEAASSSGCELVLPDGTNRYRLAVETLAGFGEARTWALDLKADLALWRDGSLPWDQLSTRLLLSGPPGTGKTSFARALGNSLELPLLVSSVSTWLEAGYLGSVITRMNAAFAEAPRRAPSILFIDECDGIGTRQPQSREYADDWNALVNKLLELMDGAAKAEGVIILGATNRPEAMDPALKRSGRWEKHIAIPMPDREALEGILAHHPGEDLEHVVGSAGEGIGAVARRAVGFSGADVERLVREARGAARRAGRTLTQDDLLARLAATRPRRSETLRRRMAVHEAGHALVCRELKIGRQVGLSVEAESGGYAETMLDHDVVQSGDWVTRLTALHLAGRAAEMVVFGNATTGSGGVPTSDLAKATRLALSMEIEFGFGASHPLLFRNAESAELLLVRDDPLADRVHARLEAAMSVATGIIETNLDLLNRLAGALAEAGSLDAEEIAKVFEASAASRASG